MRLQISEQWNRAKAWRRIAVPGLLLSFACQFGTPAFAQITKDKLHGYIGVLQGGALFSTDTPPGIASSKYSIDLGQNGTAQIDITNASFLDTAAMTNDIFSVSFWERRVVVGTGKPNASSAFWVDSVSDGRAFQAHVPWSDDNIYFDTAGCCDAGNQRIVGAIAGYVNFTDDFDFWTGWHHFVFFKNHMDKQVWIDANLFLEGTSSNALPVDIDYMLIGGGAAQMDGIIADFSMFATALSGTDITNLFNGTAPDALPASDKIVAYFNFADAVPTVDAVAGTPVGFSFTVNDLPTNTVSAATVAMTLNGTAITATSVVTNTIAINFFGDTNPVTVINYTVPNPPLAIGSTQVVTLSFKTTGGNTITATNSYVVSSYFTLTPAMALPAGSVTTNKTGFYLQTYQVDFPIPSTTAAIDSMFAGAYGPNVAQTNDSVAGNLGTNGYFTWTNYINFDIGAGDSDFLPANGYPVYEFPGIPGNTLSNSATADFAVSIVAALQFTNSGIYTMGVNSDDNFQLFTALNPLDHLTALELGSVTGGRGEADSLMEFYVAQPGLYGFNLGYDQIGGGASVEWFMVNPDGTKVLINDITNSIVAYQWLPKPGAAYISSLTPPNGNGIAPTNQPIQAVLVDGANAVATSSIIFELNGVVVPVSVTKTNGVSSITYTNAVPTTLLPKGVIDLALIYTDGANKVTNDWTLYCGYSFDSIATNLAVFQGFAVFTTNGGGHTGKPGDYAVDMTVNGGPVYVADATFMNIGAATDTMSFSFWLKRYDIDNSSIFWADSASAGGQRGWQAHAPWSDDVCYFDTTGCCTAGSQRMNASITTFTTNIAGADAYKSDTQFWPEWHHLVYTKNAGDKQIWIDGILFEDNNVLNPTAPATPLTPDFTDMAIGGVPYTIGGGDPIHGLEDDFAVFATCLSQNEITNLFKGTKPSALAATNLLVAYWAFDDADRKSVG